MSFRFKKYSLAKVIWLLDAIKLGSWNTNNIDRNSVNKQNTHSHAHTRTHMKHLEKDNAWKG